MMQVMSLSRECMRHQEVRISALTQQLDLTHQELATCQVKHHVLNLLWLLVGQEDDAAAAAASVMFGMFQCTAACLLKHCLICILAHLLQAS